MASEEHAKAEGDLQHLLDQKAAMLPSGYDAETGATVKLDERFSARAITYARPAAAKDFRLDAYAAGKKAPPASEATYSIFASGLREGANGLGLELDAR